MTDTLGQIARLFGGIALLAIGGVNAVVPEMQRQAVGVHHWMSAARFAELFALAQAAPGPNFLVATLVGLQVGGIAGASVATLALIGPSCVLTYAASIIWHRLREAPWRPAVQAGLSAVTVSLVLSAAVLLSEATSTSWRRGLLTLAVTGLVLTTRVHPLCLLAIGAGLGALGLI